MSETPSAIVILKDQDFRRLVEPPHDQNVALRHASGLETRQIAQLRFIRKAHKEDDMLGVRWLARPDFLKSALVRHFDHVCFLASPVAAGLRLRCLPPASPLEPDLRGPCR